jgi:hypothetical protein
MRLAAFVIAAALVPLFAAGPATAQRQSADDVRWIRECVTDNKDEGQSADVVLAYCTCMNNEMSSNETRSITQWEKANPRTAEACSRRAGWRGR